MPTIQEQENSELSLIDIDKSSSSSLSSSEEEQYDPEKDEIVKIDEMKHVRAAYWGIRRSSLFFGFSPLDDFFDLRYTMDYKALKSPFVNNLCRNDQKFKEAVLKELDGFKQNGKQTDVE